jgi:hypothetical protein
MDFKNISRALHDCIKNVKVILQTLAIITFYFLIEKKNLFLTYQLS